MTRDIAQLTANLNRLKSKTKARTDWKTKVSIEVLCGIVVTSTAALVFLWRLSSLTLGKVSVSELATKHQLYINSPWWKSMASLYGPYYLLLHATFAIGRSTWSLRLASILVGIACVTLVYWLVTQLHGFKIGLLASAVALLNFGQLAVSRDATPIVTQLLMVIGLLSAVMYLNRQTNILGMLPILIAVAFSLYIPGGIWLALVAIYVALPDLKDAFKNVTSRDRILLATAELVLLVPLIYHLVFKYSPTLIKNWLGYGLSGKPLHILHTLGSNMLATPLDLTFRSTNLGPDLSLGHLPSMPIVFTVLAVVGIFAYITRFKNWRWRAIIYFLAACWIMSGFGLISPLTILPILAISAGTGMAYLLKQWYSVFPINKFARNFGAIVMGVVIVFSGFYGLRSYIVAWGNSHQTITSYTSKLN